MDARTFNTMIIGILTGGKHIDGGSLSGSKHYEHYLYDGAIYIIYYNSDNAPFRIISTKINHAFTHPTRSDK